MRVLHVMAGAKEGGAETMMLDGTLALAEAGVEQRVVTRADNPHRIEALEAAGITVTAASFDRILSLSTQAKIRAAIRKLEPEVIHYWMGRAGQFAIPRWRDISLGWYGGYYKVKRFKNCAWHAGVTSDITRHITDSGVTSARAFTLHTFANISPAAPLSRATLTTPDDAPLVLFLGRLHQKKGVDTLLDALVGLPGVYCWIAGAGPLDEELKARAAALSLLDRVRFLGWRNDRSALLATCDIVAFPSRYEPFGTVTVEAWAAGKPLVVTDAAGPAATVTDGENAVLVPKGDPEALRAGLARVIENADLVRQIVNGGVRAYETNYTKQAFVRAAMTLYGRIRAGGASHMAAAAE
jgi:glycosyltransferase involved in cell wall biosynthesis